MAVFDPLDSTQITVDPELGKLPKDPLAARIAQLVAAGFTEEEAAKIAAEEIGMHGGRSVGAGVRISDNPVEDAARASRVKRLRQREAGQAAFEASYLQQEEPADMSDIDAILGRRMGPDGQYRKVRPMGPVNVPEEPLYGRRVPGPRTLSGAPVDPGQPFDNPDEAAAYDDRVDAGGGTYKPSQKDLDMMARGMVPVYNEDGSVGYAVSAPGTETPEFSDVVSNLGTSGRAGYRPDLTSSGYAARQVASPLGPQTAYLPDGAAQKKRAYLLERQMMRQAEAAGVPVSAMQKLADNPAARRALVADARTADAMARKAAWRAQTMLAGANPIKNLANALTLMDDPSFTQEQKKALQYMLPGGQLSATVDANNAKLAGQMAQQAMIAFLTNNPGALPEQRAQWQEKLRALNPAAAGGHDIAAGQVNTPDAMGELARLAESMDTTWGGFSEENQRSLAEALTRAPYNMKPEQAMAMAYQYAQRRRWVSGDAPGAPKAAAPSGQDHYNPAAPYGL